MKFLVRRNLPNLTDSTRATFLWKLQGQSKSSAALSKLIRFENFKNPLLNLFQLNEVKKIEQKKLKSKDESNNKLQKEISQLETEEIELRKQLKKSREERLAYENELKMIAAMKAKKAKKQIFYLIFLVFIK